MPFVRGLRRFVRDANWPGFVVSVLFLAIAHFGTSTNYNVWPVTKDTLDLYVYPKAKHEHVPFVFVVLIIMLYSIFIVLGEVFVVRNGRLADRLILGANLAMGIWETFFIAAGVTELGKTWVSEPRPDFKWRCLDGPGAPTFGPNGEVQCSSKDMTDARASFPSGHSSVGVSVGVYMSAYLIYTVYHRDIECFFRNGTTWKAWYYRQIASALYLVAFLPILVGGIIAASRLLDHRHSPADVTAGSLLGVVTGTAMVFTVWSHNAQNSLRAKYSQLTNPAHPAQPNFHTGADDIDLDEQDDDMIN
eukprot:m.484038 g.484038  ORF g.484038 m.484038 type:complete len:304 (+) comp23161_c0_seq1:58-969(+)